MHEGNCFIGKMAVNASVRRQEIFSPVKGGQANLKNFIMLKKTLVKCISAST